MVRTAKKAKPAGRPKLTKQDVAIRDAQMLADGERLNQALRELELSQSEAGRITGIGQNRINEIVNGTRALVREDLRSLAKAGISAEYVLGLTSTHVSPGLSRPKEQLEAELDTYFQIELAKRFPTENLKVSEPRQWVVSGSTMLQFCVEHLSKLAQSEIAEQEHAELALRRAKTLMDLATVIGKQVQPAARTHDRYDVALLDADAQQLQVRKTLLDIAGDMIKGVSQGRERGLVLARTQDVNDPTFFERMAAKPSSNTSPTKTTKPRRK